MCNHTPCLPGDHFYKANPSLPLEDQMISAMPDIKSVPIEEDGENLIIFACDGIWYIVPFSAVPIVSSCPSKMSYSLL